MIKNFQADAHCTRTWEDLAVFASPSSSSCWGGATASYLDKLSNCVEIFGRLRISSCEQYNKKRIKMNSKVMVRPEKDRPKQVWSHVFDHIWRNNTSFTSYSAKFPAFPDTKWACLFASLSGATKLKTYWTSFKISLSWCAYKREKKRVKFVPTFLLE